MTVPDPSPVLELIDAFRRSKTMFAAVSLGVFEALHEGAADAPGLAARLLGHAAAPEPMGLTPTGQSRRLICAITVRYR